MISRTLPGSQVICCCGVAPALASKVLLARPRETLPSTTTIGSATTTTTTTTTSMLGYPTGAMWRMGALRGTRVVAVSSLGQLELRSYFELCVLYELVYGT